LRPLPDRSRAESPTRNRSLDAAFLALGLLYTVTSGFTLAKCIRDRQESTAVMSRVDQARLDKLLAEHDLFKAEGA
jgi:hypothetical protein